MKTAKQKTAENKTRADTFIEAVADFLTSDVARKSIELEMHAKGIPKPDAMHWARMCSPLMLGYATKQEAIAAIKRVLFLG